MELIKCNFRTVCHVRVKTCFSPFALSCHLIILLFFIQYTGGIFSRLLAQWHMMYNMQPPVRSNTNVSSRYGKCNYCSIRDGSVTPFEVALSSSTWNISLPNQHRPCVPHCHATSVCPYSSSPQSPPFLFFFAILFWCAFLSQCTSQLEVHCISHSEI